MNKAIKLMTPGPTQVRENVRMARSYVTTNPDLDLTFYEEYKAICDNLNQLLHTNHPSYILSGEGILGLEIPNQRQTGIPRAWEVIFFFEVIFDIENIGSRL